jgi:hypothetical protein
VRKKDSALQRKFHRWLRAKGEKKTNVAISHSLLKVIWSVRVDGFGLIGRPDRNERGGDAASSLEGLNEIVIGGHRVSFRASCNDVYRG